MKFKHVILYIIIFLVLIAFVKFVATNSTFNFTAPSITFTTPEITFGTNNDIENKLYMHESDDGYVYDYKKEHSIYDFEIQDKGTKLCLGRNSTKTADKI